MSKLSTSLLIITAIVSMSAGLWLAQSNSITESLITPPKIQGAIYPSAKEVKPFQLTDQYGQRFTEDNLQGDWTLLFVGYTQCPDVCPTTLSLMASVTQELKLQDIQPPKVLFLSIDPERDTSDVMQRYVEYFDPSFTGITGTLSEVQKLSNNLNVVFRKAPGLDGEITDTDYLMDHSSALILINPKGNLQSILTAPHTLGNVIDSTLKSRAYYELQNE